MSDENTVAPITALIADDEPVARAGLRHMLADVPWIQCVGDAANGLAAVESIDRLRPDLLFLDIEMPGLSGLDVLRRIVHQPLVLFTTAYAQHAVTAFELGALDYLLKPFAAGRLATTLDRVRAALGEPLPPTADRLAEAMGHGPMTRLFVRSGSSIMPIAIESIVRFEAWGDYVTAYTARSRHLLHLSLNRLEERLDAARFVRVHRTHIVNLAHVVAFRRQDKALVAEMSDGARVAVNRTKARVLRDLGK
ncbi:MAG TPA: response regulator [Gemmatimonadaceae bacterium]|jgi:two-component system LytT family response regulator